MTDSPIRWQSRRKSRFQRALESAGAFAVAMLLTLSPFWFFVQCMEAVR